MEENRFRMQGKDVHDSERTFETLVNRLCRAGWINTVVELPDVMDFHFTAVGKERFRTLHVIAQELERELGLMTKDERAELLEIVEAWISDVESQLD